MTNAETSSMKTEHVYQRGKVVTGDSLYCAMRRGNQGKLLPQEWEGSNSVRKRLENIISGRGTFLWPQMEAHSSVSGRTGNATDRASALLHLRMYVCVNNAIAGRGTAQYHEDQRYYGRWAYGPRDRRRTIQFLSDAINECQRHDDAKLATVPIHDDVDLKGQNDPNSFSSNTSRIHQNASFAMSGGYMRSFIFVKYFSTLKDR